MCSPSVPSAEDGVHPRAGSQRFPRSRRLRRRAEFQEIYNEGIRLRGPLFTAFVRKTGTPDAGRVGLTTPRAIGNAVARNRAKRRLREAVRLHWADLPLGHEIVLHARRQILDAAWPKLEAEVKRIFHAAAKPTKSPAGRRNRH